MSDLLQTQRDLAGALRDVGRSAHAARWIEGDAARAARRLAIYRANVAAASGKALGAAYPVVRQVVGDEFFDALARRYLRQHPSTSGDLFEHGAAFGNFLADFPHAQTLPYLPDLARLEWAAHRAYGAADAAPWDSAALAQVAPEAEASIRFTWAPGTATLSSPFPIVRIWSIHQPGFEGEFAVDWGAPERALVVREGFQVAVTALGAGEAAFISESLGGSTIGACAAAGLAADASFDLGSLLQRAIASNAITGFTTQQDDGHA